jgi:hypothetical protein
MSERKYFIADDDAFDPITGLIRDGRKIRVPMSQMDGGGRRSLTFQDVQDGVDIVGITLAKLATDAVLQRNGFITDAEASLHRPGYRGTFDASVDLSASDKARAERMLADSNAWRPKDAYSSDPYTGSTTKPVETRPTNAYAPVGTKGVAEGQSCFIGNGQAGHLKKRTGTFAALMPPTLRAAMLSQGHANLSIKNGGGCKRSKLTLGRRQLKYGAIQNSSSSAGTV